MECSSGGRVGDPDARTSDWTSWPQPRKLVWPCKNVVMVVWSGLVASLIRGPFANQNSIAPLSKQSKIAARSPKRAQGFDSETLGARRLPLRLEPQTSGAAAVTVRACRRDSCKASARSCCCVAVSSEAAAPQPLGLCSKPRQAASRISSSRFFWVTELQNPHASSVAGGARSHAVA